MKKIILIISVITLFSACKKDFSVWKEYNEAKYEEYSKNLGQSEGVIDTIRSSSGLLVEVFHRGQTGITPKLNSIVYCTYSGHLADGTCFDSYVYNTQSLRSVLVKNTILGWQEILCKMPKGSHFKIYVPYTLGYGKNGTKGNTFMIPPYSTLVFDIEIVEVVQRDPSDPDY